MRKDKIEEKEETSKIEKTNKALRESKQEEKMAFVSLENNEFI